MSLPPILNPNNLATPEEAATAAIRAYCGWHVAPEHEETLTVDGTGTEVLQIRSGKVISVSQVTVNGSPVEVEWSETGLLRLKSGGRWPRRYRAIQITLTHGYAATPELEQLIAGIKARAALDPTGLITHQRAGTQGVTMQATRGAIALLESEKAILAPYRLNWGP